MSAKVSGRQGSAEQDGSCIRFSIVITCYNQRQFIKEAVESVLSQRHSSIEIIVVDDGSRDGSLEALRLYGDSIRLLELPENRGAVGARNEGAALAKGEYLIFLDGDDLFTPWALDAYNQLVAERHPTTIVSAVRSFEGPVPQFREDEKPERLEFVEYESLMAKDRRHGWPTGAFMMHRQAFWDAGGWSKGIFHMDIIDLAAKLGYSGKSILVFSPYTLLYRMHATNSIRFIRPFLRAAHLMMNRERAGGYPGGPQKRFERYAFQGGVIFHLTTRALHAGLYVGALLLVLHGWSMLLASITRKLIVRLKGRRPMEVCQLRAKESSCPALPAGMQAV